MPPEGDDVALLARYVKLLGDRTRLAIVGLLAARPRTMEELQAELGSPSLSTVTRHLRLLTEAHWVSVNADGVYQFQPETLPAMRAAVARIETAVKPAPTEPSSEPIVRAFFDAQGRLLRLPVQSAPREAILKQISEQRFTVGRIYDEKEVDALLRPVKKEAVNLRRHLVDEGFLETRNARYWVSLKRSLGMTPLISDSSDEAPAVSVSPDRTLHEGTDELALDALPDETAPMESAADEE